MNKFITDLITIYQAEHLKKKKKGIYWTSFIVGILFPSIGFYLSMKDGYDNHITQLPYNFYEDFIAQKIIGFANFFFPLIIIISAGRITQLDHKKGGWKLMETSPIKKASIFFGKFSVLLTNNLIAILGFMLSSMLFSFILITKGGTPTEASTVIPIGFFIQLTLRLLIGSLLISSIQYVLSVRFKGMTWPLLIGFIGLIGTLFLRAVYLKKMPWNPFRMLEVVGFNIHGSDLGNLLLYTEWLSLIVSIPVLVLGLSFYQYQSFYFALIKDKKRGAAILLTSTAALIAAWTIITPKQMESYNKTVLAGVINSDTPIDNIYLINAVTKDTITKAVVENNHFHTTIDNQLVTNYYQLYADNKFENKIFLGAKDSLYIEVDYFNQKNAITIGGTRLAENNIIKKSENQRWFIKHYLNNDKELSNVPFFEKMLFNELKDRKHSETQGKTIDNYIPREDFKNRHHKLLTIQYLNYWETFKQKRKALYPDQETLDNEKITMLKKEISLEDETLLGSSSYITYINQELTKQTAIDELEPNLVILEAYKNISDESFKNKVSYIQLKKALKEANKSSERYKITSNYLSLINNASLKKEIEAYSKQLNLLDHGNLAPNFSAINAQGEAFSLEAFKGQYLIIDVWATWCGPCKRESPFFEKYALQFKDQNITFLSLSVDQDDIKWKASILDKKSITQQLIVINKNLFSKHYNIEAIPRFIFIDPEGKLINAEMPLPSQNAFEIFIQNELDKASSSNAQQTTVQSL
ncbi:MAG: ABC transporter permease [Flavobacteriales bacterium]|jgi:thiol-disulfide isomerase/thioredoxin|nr:ABC transporter permease [Flavobacteriales bacterium]